MKSLPVPPATVTPDNAPFFAALQDGRLDLPRCDDCDAIVWYPRHHCPACGGSSLTWFTASGRGAVYSFTVVRRGQGEWEAAAPYVLAYVELDEGPRVLTNILTEDPSQVRIGARVEAVVERGEGAPPVLRFRLGV